MLGFVWVRLGRQNYNCRQWLCFLQACASTTNPEDLMDPILNQTSGCHRSCERIEPEDNEALKADSVLNFAFFFERAVWKGSSKELEVLHSNMISTLDVTYVILCASLRTNLPLSLYLRATTTLELNFLSTSVEFIKCHPCPLLQPFEGTVSATFIRFQLKC